jgi:uncharacterized protein (TIGR02217 family)
MSTAVFPTLPGISWNVIKTPMWSTRIQKAISGREYRAAYYSLPLWKFSIKYEVLRAGLGELQTLIGFFNARQGSFDTFLYTDPSDYQATNQVFGTGDGATTKFQLLRSIGSFTEPIVALPSQPIILGNGVVQNSVVTNLTTGVVTFVTAPIAGLALTWTGSFQYRCRFLQDSADFDNFMRLFWDCKKIEFVSVK